MEPQSVDQVLESVRELSLDPVEKLACTFSQEAGQAQDAPSPEQDDDGHHVCPICLDMPDLAEAAALHGCGHSYCVTCILRWASRKESGATCPQCKASFTHVVTHRKPSGTLAEFPTTVAVSDLLDSCWFAYHKRQLDKGKAPVHDAYENDEYEDFDYDYDEDQEVEDFYMSAAAGRARIVLGNRRFGDGGYVSSGRRNARPVQQSKQPSGKKPAGKAVASPGGQQQQGGHKQAQVASPAGSSAACTPSPSSSSGRRARRNARRKAVDELHGGC